MPMKWFIHRKSLIAIAWTLRAVVHDLKSGWIIEQFRSIEVEQDQFLVLLKNWESSGATSGLPYASDIYGMYFILMVLLLQ
jgi:hypothetical protein